MGKFGGGGVVIWVWVLFPVDIDVDVRVRLAGVKVWNFLLRLFGESRYPLVFLLPHLGCIFLCYLIPPRLCHFHHHCYT